MAQAANAVETPAVEIIKEKQRLTHPMRPLRMPFLVFVILSSCLELCRRHDEVWHQIWKSLVIVECGCGDADKSCRLDASSRRDSS
jgi:hypothetical protein